MARPSERRTAGGPARKSSAKPSRARRSKPKEAEGGEDVYEVDCVNIEPAEETSGKADAVSDQEVVAEKINVGESERIVIYRKSQKKSCSRYVLKDIFD